MNSERLLVSLYGLSIDHPGRQRIIVGYDTRHDPIWKDSGLRVAEHTLFEVPDWLEMEHVLSMRGVRLPTDGERHSGKVEGKSFSEALRDKMAASHSTRVTPFYEERDASGRVVESSASWPTNGGRG